MGCSSDPFEPPRLFATAPEASNDPYEPPRLYRNPASDPLEPPRLYGNTDQPSATSPFEPPRLYSDTAKVTVNSPLEPPRLYADSDNSPNRPSLEPERLYTSRSPLSSPSAPPMSHLSVFSTSSPLDAPRLYTNSAPVSPLLYSPGVFEAPRLYGNVEGDDDDHPGSDPTTPTAASMAAPPSERSTLLSFISPVMYSPAVRTPRSRTPSPVANSSRSAGTVRINPEFPLAGPYKRDSWYLSSAATHHVTPRRPIFSRFEVLSPPVKVIIAGVTYDAEGQGDVHVVWDTGEWKDANAKSPSSPNPIAGAKRITHRVLMRNVRYVPTAPAGFVAVGPLQAKGIVFEVQGMGSTDAERVRLHADGRAEVPGREYCLLKGAKEKGGALMGKAVKDGAAWRLLTVQS
ncbi:hypothetical protein BKA62DRAFT_322943 [Auriculariales sp. MPI-PUGE-AT-0066]|nr:hypothetical protein BKA62DRAFT_322943 [Auriculariales sp. MPI-PUGE-AT-0066]